MLKRIAVLSENEQFHREAAAVAAAAGAQTVPVSGASDMPAGVSAIVADAGKAAAAIEGALALEDWNAEILVLLTDALDCREDFLPGSSRRVMDHATRFAQAASLDPEDQFTLERAALVRDIGKIRVGNEILLKKGLLTYDEWRLIHHHPRLGADIVAKTTTLQDTADIVAMHHESWDGDGYPDGIEGEAIPRMARMMKIIDVYCAMTSPRHYRQGHATHGEATEFLRSEQGKHFDPDLVDVFIDAKVGHPWA